MRYSQQYMKRGRWKPSYWETEDREEAQRMADAKRRIDTKLKWRIYDRKTRKTL